MTPLVLAVAAGCGTHLLYTALTGATDPGPSAHRADWRRRGRDWLVQAGLGDARPAEILAVVTSLTIAGASLTWLLFGGVLAPVAGGVVSAMFPTAAARARRERRRQGAREAWPRLIEELRVKAGSLGRPLPQALFEIGAGAPEELSPAFAAARREWLLTTDFERACLVLKDQLADATADVVCETLLVAHEVGGTEVDRFLAALVEDRLIDLHGRKDAAARQAGARFARRFVLVVPLGMALVGLSIGHGRQAYASPTGQLLVAAGLALVGACWLWAGRIMRLPEERRVFHARRAV